MDQQRDFEEARRRRAEGRHRGRRVADDVAGPTADEPVENEVALVGAARVKGDVDVFAERDDPRRADNAALGVEVELGLRIIRAGEDPRGLADVLVVIAQPPQRRHRVRLAQVHQDQVQFEQRPVFGQLAVDERHVEELMRLGHRPAREKLDIKRQVGQEAPLDGDVAGVIELCAREDRRDPQLEADFAVGRQVDRRAGEIVDGDAGVLTATEAEIREHQVPVKLGLEDAAVVEGQPVDDVSQLEAEALGVEELEGLAGEALDGFGDHVDDHDVAEVGARIHLDDADQGRDVGNQADAGFKVTVDERAVGVGLRVGDRDDDLLADFEALLQRRQLRGHALRVQRGLGKIRNPAGANLFLACVGLEARRGAGHAALGIRDADRDLVAVIDQVGRGVARQARIHGPARAVEGELEGPAVGRQDVGLGDRRVAVGFLPRAKRVLVALLVGGDGEVAPAGVKTDAQGLVRRAAIQRTAAQLTAQQRCPQYARPMNLPACHDAHLLLKGLTPVHELNTHAMSQLPAGLAAGALRDAPPSSVARRTRMYPRASVSTTISGPCARF